MSHDKIKAAARKRMAQTGESYASARREVIKEYQATQRRAPKSDGLKLADAFPTMGALSSMLADTGGLAGALGIVQPAHLAGNHHHCRRARRIRHSRALPPDSRKYD